MEYLETVYGFDALKYFEKNTENDPYLCAKENSHKNVMKYLEIKYDWLNSSLSKNSLYNKNDKKRKISRRKYKTNIKRSK